ncbi:MAG: DNRLRE domain-containing protein [Ginsengibacter sp.]
MSRKLIFFTFQAIVSVIKLNIVIALVFSLQAYAHIKDCPAYSANSLNNAAPVFYTANYSFDISESIAVGNAFGNINATDPDGDAITYSIINGNTNNTFSIDVTSGSISLVKYLNHHKQDKFIIRIRATDITNLYGDATIVVTVLPGNSLAAFTNISWGTAAIQPKGTHEIHGEVVNNKLYIFGGYNPDKRPGYIPTKRSFVYDPLTNKWSNIADLPHTPFGTDFGGVTHEGLTTDGTDIYIAGGYISNSSGTGQVFGTKQAWRYNVKQNNFTALPQLPIDLAAGQLQYLRGKLHFLGGANKSRIDVSVHYALDLDNLAAGWKQLASIANPRNHGGSAVFKGKIYLIGGSHGQDDASITQKTVEAYDADADSWIQLADLPVPRDHISSAVVAMGNRIIVLGGKKSRSVTLDLVSAYSPGNNTWIDLTPLTATKSAGVAAVLNGAIHYTGGNFSNTNRKGTIVGGSLAQTVDSFTLINVDNGQPIKTIANNDVINLATLPSVKLNIRANTNSATVGSVVFNLTGAEIKNVTENLLPYALFGDDMNGTYNTWTPAIGNYNLQATPYSSSGGNGSAGVPLSITFTVINNPIQTFALNPLADSHVRNGTYSDKTYGTDTVILVKGSPNSGFTRHSFTKFDLSSITKASSARLKIFGHNLDNTTSIILTVFGVNNDSWTENNITFNNQPSNITSALSTIAVNDQKMAYEFDVTSFVKSEIAGDKVVSFLIRDVGGKDKLLSFNSRENSRNSPQLIISNSNSGSDLTPPTIDILFDGTLVSPDTYKDRVQISINSSDSGGSGLAYSQYSLNNGAYQNYTDPFLVDIEGIYTIKAKAVDGDGNITETNEKTFSVVKQAMSITLLPIADASVRNGAYSDKNYGSDPLFLVKASPNVGFTRVSYLKFSLGNIDNVADATLRVYGSNTVDNTGIILSCHGVTTDSWSENNVTWNNAPASLSAPLSSVSVNGQLQYYEFDVTDFVKGQFSDQIVSVAIKDTYLADKILSFSSKENGQNPPQLIIENLSVTISNIMQQPVPDIGLDKKLISRK